MTEPLFATFPGPFAFFFQNNTSSIISWLYFTVVMVLLGLFLLFLRMRNEEEKKTQDQFQSINDHLKALDARAGELVEALTQIGTLSQANTAQLTEAISKLQISAATPAASKPHDDKKKEPATLENKEEKIIPTADTALAEENFEKAVQFLRNMEDEHPENLLKARDLFLHSTGGDRAGEAYSYLAETLFWLGDITEDKTQKERFHGEGVEYGKNAVKHSPNSVEANLWYAANMGSHGMARGIMSSLFYLGDIDKYGSQAMTLDKAFFHGAPLRLMGRFYHQCPGWPIGKGDIGKAIKLLEQAVEVGPGFLLNHLYLAEAYIAKRRKKEARQVLENMLKQEQFEVMPHYQKNVQELARELMKKT